MLRWALIVTFLMLLIPSSLAQSKAEIKFNQKQAKELNDFAEGAFKAGFPKYAKNIWQMLLSEYDHDHAGAREALGFEKSGDSWVKKSDFSYPRNDKPDPKKAASLKKKWEKVAKKLADNHLKLAREYGKTDRTDLSRKHYEKVLFFRADNEEAQAALDHKEVAGLTGTDLEQTLYERSKKIEAIVAQEARQDYPVERLPDTDRNHYLDKAEMTYISVKSEHFIVRGDFEEELLMESARYGERAIRVMTVVCEGYSGFNLDPKRWVKEWCFFQTKESYRQILNANKDLIPEERLSFILEETSSTTLGSREHGALGVSSPNNALGVYDGSVRRVARTIANLGSPALGEGLGHTIVGMMFNNNRQFVVDRETQKRTSTGEEDLDRFSPNMDTWKDLVLETAWNLTQSTPAAQLPLITADKFPDDARIKSWSFCDYVVRRDPTLLLDLDRLNGEGHTIEVEKKFTEEHDGLSIAQLEKEWKDFWTGASPVMKHILNNTEPMTSVSPGVKTWLKGFNEARKIRSSTEVTWSSNYSARCNDHAKYLALHEDLRGPAAEQSEDINLEGSSHLGDIFAEMALVDTAAKKPKDVFKRWLDYPGYRDALVNSSLLMVGLYIEDGILVMDAIRGIGRAPDNKGGFKTYPDGLGGTVPTSVKVADLGPELEALLEKRGHGDLEVVGYPISLHQFGNGGLRGNRDSYTCKVTIMGKPVEGILHHADGGTNRRTSAPGMIVFYPLEPLRKGVEVEVTWIYETDDSTERKSDKFKT